MCSSAEGMSDGLRQSQRSIALSNAWLESDSHSVPTIFHEWQVSESNAGLWEQLRRLESYTRGDHKCVSHTMRRFLSSYAKQSNDWNIETLDWLPLRAKSLRQKHCLWGEVHLLWVSLRDQCRHCRWEALLEWWLRSHFVWSHISLTIVSNEFGNAIDRSIDCDWLPLTSIRNQCNELWFPLDFIGLPILQCLSSQTSSDANVWSFAPNLELTYSLSQWSGLSNDFLPLNNFWIAFVLLL